MADVSLFSRDSVCARQHPKEPLSEAEGRVWRSGANKPREQNGKSGYSQVKGSRFFFLIVISLVLVLPSVIHRRTRPSPRSDDSGNFRVSEKGKSSFSVHYIFMKHYNYYT